MTALPFFIVQIYCSIILSPNLSAVYNPNLYTESFGDCCLGTGIRVD